MTAPLLLDLTHTCHSQAHTGIQRVARSLYTALAARGAAQPVTWDLHARAWRSLEAWEIANLANVTAGSKRSARWPLAARLRGLLRRRLSRTSAFRSPLSNSGLLELEIPTVPVAAALPALFAQTRGPCAALFYDALALQFPEFAPPKTVARFPAYLQELSRFDGIAAISADSRDVLLSYWTWLGLRDTPPVEAIPLGIDLPSVASVDSNPLGCIPSKPATPAALPTVLCVCTLEGRKNHLVLLAACEQLWTRGVRFELRLIGMAQAETGRTALARVRALQAAGWPLRYDGPVDDTAVTTAYRECLFTVYPSLLEGFGMPVLESLALGKPCICSAHGPVGESARGGGCLALDDINPATLAAAIERLLAAPAELAALATAASARQLKSWGAYTDELLAWQRTLHRRS
ncbi:MAG TPA: glycosyltransferase [Opitutaceae bacterium]|nr:glycosyltransferase [Opitutaceae bacterium]